jgi:exodeoxyribonuclease X
VRATHPISPIHSAVHHIINEDLTGAPDLMTAWEIARRAPAGEVIDAFAAHSAKFERLHITDAMTGDKPWICTYKSALRIWSDAPSHSNGALLYWRRPVGWERKLSTPAHRAGPDSYVTALHLRDMLDLVEPAKLIEWSCQPALQTTCHIGRQRGMKWTEVDYGFLEWVSDKDFDEDVIFTVRHEMKRRDEEQQKAREEAASERSDA